MPATPKDDAKEDSTETASPILPKAEKDPNLVEVTITKLGEGKVSTGVHVTGEGDIYAERKQKILVSKKTAERLEVLGFAERD